MSGHETENGVILSIGVFPGGINHASAILADE
jgi:hypothetical protein